MHSLVEGREDLRVLSGAFLRFLSNHTLDCQLFEGCTFFSVMEPYPFTMAQSFVNISIYNPCPCVVFWPIRYNLKDTELKLCIFSKIPYH